MSAAPEGLVKDVQLALAQESLDTAVARREAEGLADLELVAASPAMGSLTPRPVMPRLKPENLVGVHQKPQILAPRVTGTFPLGHELPPMQ